MEDSRQKFAAAVAEYNARPSLPPCAHMELLRDGRVIAGEVCRFTMGTVVLCESARNPFFCGGSKDATDIDLIEAYWLMQERNISDAVWLVEDGQKLRKQISKYAKGLTTRDRIQIANELFTWLNDIHNAMPTSQGDEVGDTRRADWYLDIIDVFAERYGWSDEHVMWYLPWARNVRLREAAASRTTGKPVQDEIDSDLAELLTFAKGMAENG